MMLSAGPGGGVQDVGMGGSVVGHGQALKLRERSEAVHPVIHNLAVTAF
jgi:hypothetical protein